MEIEKLTNEEYKKLEYYSYMYGDKELMNKLTRIINDQEYQKMHGIK